MAECSTRPVRRPVHALVYGDPGSGKSHFAATFPKPMLVLLFDPYGKETPYLRDAYEQVESAIELVDGQLQVPIVEGTSEHGRTVVEYYHDEDPDWPTAWERFAIRARAIDPKEWATIVFDSASFMELAARKNEEKRRNPTAKDPRLWYGASRGELEEQLIRRVMSYRTNVVTVAHVSTEKAEMHGTVFLRNPRFPGKMAEAVGAAYSEFYRAFVARDAEGKLYHTLQTAASPEYNAGTQIDAGVSTGGLVHPHYDALWADFDARRARRAAAPVEHALVSAAP